MWEGDGGGRREPHRAVEAVGSPRSGKGDAVKTYSKQYRNLATIITGVGLTFFSITAEAETIGYEQSPGHFGGFDSDGPGITVADEFQLDQSAFIQNIT